MHDAYFAGRSPAAKMADRLSEVMKNVFWGERVLGCGFVWFRLDLFVLNKCCFLLG